MVAIIDTANALQRMSFSKSSTHSHAGRWGNGMGRELIRPEQPENFIQPAEKEGSGTIINGQLCFIVIVDTVC